MIIRVISHKALNTILAIFISLPVSQSTAYGNGTFVLEADEKFITLQANNASLKDIFTELENQTGILVSLETSTTELVTFEMHQQPFLSVIEKLAPNHLVINGAFNGKRYIKELVILSNDPAQQSGGGGFENLPTGEPAEEVVQIEETYIEEQPPIEEPPIEEIPLEAQEMTAPQN